MAAATHRPGRTEPRPTGACSRSAHEEALRADTVVRRWRGRSFTGPVVEILSPPDELIIFCGMSIGFKAVTVSRARTGRAPLAETVRFVEG